MQTIFVASELVLFNANLENVISVKMMVTLLKPQDCTILTIMISKFLILIFKSISIGY